MKKLSSIICLSIALCFLSAPSANALSHDTLQNNQTLRQQIKQSSTKHFANGQKNQNIRYDDSKIKTAIRKLKIFYDNFADGVKDSFRRYCQMIEEYGFNWCKPVDIDNLVKKR